MVMQYKDDRPENTCNRVEDVLNRKYGFSFKSTQSNSGEISPSFGLMNKEMVMFTNGKGVSTEYALASAYGEMCERLFNLCPARMENISVEDMEIKSDFFEQYGRDKVREELKRFIEVENDNDDSSELIEAMMQFVDMYSWPKKNELINCITYTSRDGEKYIIPYMISDILLGTNGMAAGNSYEEAYVQAFCELIERKAVKDFCEGKVIPKRVPKEDLADSTLWRNTLSVIDSKEDELEIEAYTFEEYYNFPVAFVLLTNRKEGYVKYKFGAHFDISCAVERCITEMVQGAELVDYSKWQKIEWIAKKERADILLIFKDGSGLISGEAYRNVLQSKEFLKSKWDENCSKDAYDRIHTIVNNIYVHKSVSNPLYVLQLYVPKWSVITWLNSDDWRSATDETEVARYLKNAMDLSNRNNCEMFVKKAKMVYKDEVTLADISRSVCPVEKQYLQKLTLGEYALNIERFYTKGDGYVPLNYCEKCVRHNRENCIVNKRREFCRGIYNEETIA